MTARTLLDRIWSAHAAAELEGDRVVLLIDRVLLHDVTGGYALRDLCAAERRPAMPADDIYAVADHAISTSPDRGNYDSTSPNGGDVIRSLEETSRALGIRYVAPDSAEHGTCTLSHRNRDLSGRA